MSKLILAVCGFVGAYALAWSYWPSSHNIQFNIGTYQVSGALIVAFIVVYLAIKSKD